ncbi:MAG: hypothetical protein L6V93_03415 [Clostridiales bacterium]|nr:MAG: hypothetical protein L6V93_03415 [Clostridiales bacterium]
MLFKIVVPLSLPAMAVMVLLLRGRTLEFVVPGKYIHKRQNKNIPCSLFCARYL